MTFPWGNTRPFNSLADQNKQKYGSRIQKVSINAGFTCPNRDGTIARGGCTFCNNSGFSPSYCNDGESITSQIEKGIKFLLHRYKRAKIFVAYFQSFSNTYDSIEVLKTRYEEALSHPLISGITIGTRPDCIDKAKLDYIASLAQEKIISIEFGVETCNDKTLIKINRGHTFQQSVAAIKMSAGRNIHTGIHLIIGLPGEDKNELLRQSRIISDLPINSVKFHQLQIVKDTAMAREYSEFPERFSLFEPDEYVTLACDYLENLRPDIAIERFAGEVPPDYNIVQSWKGLRSDMIMKMIETEFNKRGSWQGKNYSP